MSDFQGNPGAIDDPGMKGGTEPDLESLPSGDSADDTGDEASGGQPVAAELDLPGPNDPVAWNYVQPGTPIAGREGVKIGSVEVMLGTEAEGIFHGIAMRPASGGTVRVVPADMVTSLTPSEVQVQLTVNDVRGLAEFDESVPATA